MIRKLIYTFIFTSIVTTLDQITKYAVVFLLFTSQTYIPHSDQYHHHLVPHKVSPFLDIVLVWNHGISFGMFNNAHTNQLILIILSSIIILMLLVWLLKPNSYVSHIAVSLIMGGAIGNIIDRVRFGAVIDFIDFHFHQHHYPAFNIADLCIVVGVLGLFMNLSKSE